MAYPASFDELTIVSNDATVSKANHAQLHNNANDAINRIQLALGKNPQGAFEDLAARLTAAFPQYDPYELLPYLIPMNLWPGTTVEPVAKRAYFTRFTVAKKREFKFVRFIVTTAAGAEDKIDTGILKVNGAKLERLGSSGNVKMPVNSTGVKKSELTGTVTCEPGIVYVVSQSWETKTTAPNLAAVVNNNGFYGDIGGAGTLANRIFTFKAETNPIPATVEAILEASATVTPFMVPSLT